MIRMFEGLFGYPRGEYVSIQGAEKRKIVSQENEKPLASCDMGK